MSERPSAEDREPVGEPLSEDSLTELQGLTSRLAFTLSSAQPARETLVATSRLKDGDDSETMSIQWFKDSSLVYERQRLHAIVNFTEELGQVALTEIYAIGLDPALCYRELRHGADSQRSRLNEADAKSLMQRLSRHLPDNKE